MALGLSMACAACGHEFPIEDGIPRLFWPHSGMNSGDDVTEIVKAFYEETPFPNYDEHETVRSLVEKSRRGLYARRLDESIAFNSEVLEIGCGTGQLANFLGLSCRRVVVVKRAHSGHVLMGSSSATVSSRASIAASGMRPVWVST